MVRVRPDSAWLGVRGELELPAEDTARPALALVLHSVFRGADFEIVRPRGLDSTAVSRDSSDNPTVWTLRPKRPIPAHTRVLVRFAYSARVASVRPFHVGDDGSFVEVGWYPQEQNALRRDSRATGTLEVDAPPGYMVIGTGERRSDATQEARGHFAFATALPRRLAFTVGRYAVVHGGSRIPISVYFLHERPHAAAFVDGARRALDALVREFGPFPYSSLAIVEVPTGPARASGFGGRSANGIVLATSDNIDRGFNLGFFAHEISHQWWADMLEPTGTEGEVFMLTEAMATYGSLRAVESLEGSAAAEHYRRIGYPGFNDSNLAYYLTFAATGLDTVPLARLDDLMLAHDLAGTKGFRVWDMLGREIGRDRFRNALMAFARAHAFRIITLPMFAEAMGRAAGRTLDWFFAEWVTARTGAPEWRLEWRQTGESVKGSVTQLGQPYRLHVQLAAAGGSTAETSTRSIEISRPVTTFERTLPFLASSVTLDPHFYVLHWTPEVAEEARGTAPVNRANWLDLLGHHQAAIAADLAALDSVPDPDRWGIRYQAHYGLGWLYMRANDWRAARTHMLAALDLAAQQPSPGQLACRAPGGSCAVPWGWYVVARVAGQLGDSTLLCKAIRSARTADSAGRWGAAAQARALAPQCPP